ncbi:MAG: autotransporter-associated beta strand repeat-containing protein [Planctomycetia bacterium]|nr:autotransporter-associated beta strand repeat-containing protein [Planctomycetia bacterium]
MLAFVVGITFSGSGALRAQTSTWLKTTSGNWSLADNWSTLPIGGPTALLLFNGSGAQAYIATNDLADPFFMNQIVLNSTSSGTPTIAGAQLRFVGSNAQIKQDGGGAFIFTAPIKFDLPLTLAGSGAGYVTFNGALSGMGGIIKSGTSTFVFGSPAADTLSSNTFVGGLTIADGTIRFDNTLDTGPTALRSNRITFTSGAGSLRFGGPSATTPTELRIGEISGAAGLVLARTTAVNENAGLNVVITTLGDASYGGTFDNTGTGAGLATTLKIRGVGNQTFSNSVADTFKINGDLETFHGATTTLANFASTGTASAGKIILSGGTFVLDNVARNDNDRIRTSGTVDMAGGGTFRLLGNASGTAEVSGRLELGDNNMIARGGALKIEIVHIATSSPTTLTFSVFERDSSSSPRSTVDFAAVNASGTAIPLGGGGTNPRIILTTGVRLTTTNLLFSRSNSSASNNTYGYATVNGTDFATYGSNGVVAAGFTTWSGTANSSTNFNLSVNGTTGTSSSTFSIGSLKLTPASGSIALDINGSGNLQTNGILLAGSNNAAITSSGGGGWVGFGMRFAHVQSAVLTIGASIGSDNNPLVKAGGGTLYLSNTSNVNSTATLTINDGVVRASSTTLPTGTIEFRGGVLEVTGGGTFNRALGTTANTLNWQNGTFDRGSGGFAAWGAAVTIDLKNLGADQLSWRETNFVGEGYALIFGSKTADARVSLLDDLNLSESSVPSPETYNAREIQIVDNPNSPTDFARLSGQVSGAITDDLLKTGAGILELTNTNTYLGGTIIAEGSLLVANSAGLGDLNAAYVLLGARSGSADVALLTSSTSTAITIKRDILVQSGGTGSAMLGNTIALDAVSASNAVFSGNILVGLQGDSLAKSLKFTAVAGTTVTFSGSITTHSGYTGTVSMQKVGGGDVLLSGATSYSGATTVSAGKLIIGTGGLLAGSGGVSVAAGATLMIAVGGQITGSGAINVSGSAAIDNASVNRGTVIVNGTAGTSNASIVVGQGGLLQGNNGVVNGSVTIQRGGGIGPGNSVGTLNISGPSSSTWEAGSHVYFEFRHAGGNAPGTDWDYLNLGASHLNINGTAADPIFLHIDSWLSNNNGHGSNDFDSATTYYHWKFVTTGGIDLAASTGSFADRFIIVDATTNAGVFGTGIGNPATRLSGSFYVTLVGSELYLDYSTVPEPGSATLVGVAVAAGIWQRRRSTSV